MITVTRSEMTSLRNLAGQWRAGRRGQKAAAQLDAVLDYFAGRADGPNLLAADVYGNTVPDLERAALYEARRLYGEQADLRIEHTGRVSTAFRTDKGRFTAEVLVRCVNFPAEES